MRLFVENLTYNQVSIDTITLAPRQSNTFDIPDADIQQVISQLALAPSVVKWKIDGITRPSIDTALTIFVETTGSDTTGDGTYTRPFRTIQKAIDSLGDGVLIKAEITIQVGIGSFGGFTFDQSKYRYVGTPGVNNIPRGIRIQGTMVAPTLTTGTASGTATGAATTDGARVFTDSGQNWTIDELKGKFLEISSSKIPIVSNTATTITTSTSLGIAAGAYKIWDHGTIIDSGLQYASSGAAGTSIGRVAIIGNTDASTASFFEFREIRVDSTGLSSGNSVVTMRGQSNAIRMTSCELRRTSATAVTLLSALNNYAAATHCFFNHPDANASSFGMTYNQDGGPAWCYFLRGGIGVNISNLGHSSPAIGSVTSSTFEGCTTGINHRMSAQMNIVATCRFLNCTTGVAVASGTFTVGAALTGTAGGALFFFSGCTTCLQVSNGSHVFFGNSTGTGNTNGIVATAGARIQVSASATLGASTELSVDGATSTLAAMRASSPKVFPTTPNAYGSYIYE